MVLLYASYMSWEQRDRNINRSLKMNKGFFTFSICVVFWVFFGSVCFYLSEGFKACLESFGSSYWLKPSVRWLRSCRCAF